MKKENQKFDTITEQLLYGKKEPMDNELKCPLCWEKETFNLTEYMWAYDWWLTLECRKCWKQSHRISKKAITANEQPVEYWPVFFRSGGKHYRNLTLITKKEYDKWTTWGI